MTHRYTILISGGGGLMARVVAAVASGVMPFIVNRVVASRHDAGGVTRAREAGVPVAVVERAACKAPADFCDAVWKVVDADPPDTVLLLGWLHLLTIPPRWRGRVINIHPSLLPLFGGKGMYGHHVHEAVIRSSMRVSGFTIHLATDEYDAGPILHQSAVAVRNDDTSDTLADRVVAAQHELLVPFLRAWATSEVTQVNGRWVGGPAPHWFDGGKS